MTTIRRTLLPLAALATLTLVACDGDGPASAADASSCEELGTIAFERIDETLEELRADVDADEDAIMRLLTDDPLDPALRPLLAIAPGRPFAGLGGDVQVRYAELGCGPDEEYPAIDAWVSRRYLDGAAPPEQGAGAAGALVLPRVDHGGEALVVGALLNRRYSVGPPDSVERAALTSALERAIAAQEAHRVARGRYADREEDLAEFGFDGQQLEADEDFFFMIFDGDEGSYCMALNRQGTAYAESSDGMPVVEQRTDPCPETFPG